MPNLPVPTPATAVAGNFLTSALWNAQVRDGVGFLVAPPSFRAYATVAQGLADGTWTSLSMDTEQFDGYGGHSTTVNTSRYTCQVAGIYMVTGVAAFMASSAGTRGVRLAVNGTPVAGTFVRAPATSTVSIMGLPISALVQMAVGDYVEVQGQQAGGGGSFNTFVGGPDSNPSLQVHWISS